MKQKGESETSPVPRPETRLRPDEDEDEPMPGAVSHRLFVAAMGTASAVLLVSVVTFFGVGMVIGASLGPGIGGFVADFEDINYDDGDAQIYPILGEHPACEDAPQLEANLDGKTELNGDVTFYKDLPLPDTSFEPGQTARLSIVADSGQGSIEVEDLNLRLTALIADEIQLGDTQLREFGPDDYEDSGDPKESLVAPDETGNLDPNADPDEVPEFGIDAETFILPEGGSAAAHQVSLGSIDLHNLNLFIAIGDEDDFTDPVQRAVEPTERDCDSLADET